MPKGQYVRKPRSKPQEPLAADVVVAQAASNEGPATAGADAPAAPEVRPEALPPRTYFVTLARHKGEWKHRLTNASGPQGYGKVSYAGEMVTALTFRVEATSPEEAQEKAMTQAGGITL